MTNTGKKIADDGKPVGLRDAIEAARHYMTEALGRNLEDLQLEETEYSDNRDRWLITFGYLRAEPTANSMFNAAGALFPNKERVYKIITVDARTGEANQIEIRKP